MTNKTTTLRLDSTEDKIEYYENRIKLLELNIAKQLHSIEHTKGTIETYQDCIDRYKKDMQ